MYVVRCTVLCTYLSLTLMYSPSFVILPFRKTQGYGTGNGTGTGTGTVRTSFKDGALSRKGLPFSLDDSSSLDRTGRPLPASRDLDLAR
jgi:hypothetical protein